MKVAMVSEHASPLAVLGGVDAGGQNVHVASLAAHLGKLGAEVTVHTRRDNPRVRRRVPLAPRVWVDHVPAGPPLPVGKDDLLPYMDELARELRAAWERSRPDLVHAHFWMSGLASLAAAKPLGIPVVQTFHALGVVKRRHQGPADTSPAERLRTEAGIVGGADHILATCTDELFELVRLGADPARVTIVPCGVDLDLFTPEGPMAPRPRGVYRILSVGRLVPRKGIDSLVSALPHLPRAELLVAGGPSREDLARDPEARRLLQLAQELGVVHRLRLLGRVGRTELPALMRSADVVACVPWYEPFGMVPLEAMACGVPVVASAVGGLVDTVLDGVTGLLVAPRQPVDLARVLARFLRDPRWRVEVGRAGAERARARYSWPRVAAATFAVYTRVLDDAGEDRGLRGSGPRRAGSRAR
jgi:D-inositol-3-phosphate glycosyltransferase